MQKIILASQSPRRKQLLEWAQISFDIVVEETDESYPEDYDFGRTAVHIARNKALAVKKIKGTKIPILAADTIVVLKNYIIGKPKDRSDAIRILQMLAGKKHHVITGVVILYNNKEISFSETTQVSFHTLTQAQIEFYVDTYKPYDKAGAYAIQEWIGVVGIKNIKGDFYNVMGLPVSRVVQKLGDLLIS
jgi:septum formation protein